MATTTDTKTTTTTEAAKRKAAAEKAAATRKKNQAAEARKNKAAAEKAAATRKRNAAAAKREKVAPKRAPIAEREPRIIAEDASFAAAGLAIDAVTLVRHATTKLEQLRAEVRKAASDPAGTFKGYSETAPTTVTRTVGDVRGRLVAELETAIAKFEKTFNSKATEGRKLVEALKNDTRVAKLLDQSSNTRSQVKAALTSLTRTVDVAVDAGRKQAGTATSQIKGATTSVTKTVDVAVDASRKQAENAASQVKAAATSIRKTADAIPAAAEGVEKQVEKAS
ncbi:MAG: hypothetical protein WEB03_07970 [Nitriliruptor sp.]|uniref:hypothetical protein n=1 Tax=Nitriliruptor sp. TaxID=2448056 RepID=UPI0034A03216